MSDKILDISDIKSTRKSIKQSRTGFNILNISFFIFLLVFGFLLILFLGGVGVFENLPSAIQYAAFISPFILIFFQIRKERRRNDELLYILRNRIQFIIDYMHEHNHIFLRNDTLDKRIRDKVKKYISKLEEFGPKLLVKLECEISGLDFGHLNIFEVYSINDTHGIKLKTKNKENKEEVLNITNDEERIKELLIKLNRTYKKRINFM